MYIYKHTRTRTNQGGQESSRGRATRRTTRALHIEALESGACSGEASATAAESEGKTTAETTRKTQNKRARKAVRY
jgi:hypothetical protein